MTELLEKIFNTREFKNSKGETIKIHSETFRSQCVFLQDLIKQYNFRNSIEIGFAYGTSTVAILEEITKNSGTHTVIDPFQNKHWGGNGIDLVNQSGFSKDMIFIEDFSYSALPELLKSGKKYDFAYIDTTKILDYLVVDFFFLDKMIEVGGIISFDDVHFPGIRKLLRYLSQFPHYEVIGQYPKNKKQNRSLKQSLFLKLFPKQINNLRENISVSDFDLGVNANCIALKKISEDDRRWDWYTKF